MASEREVLQTVTISVVVEVPVSPAWGPDCPISQVAGQASESALHTLRKALEGSSIRVRTSTARARLSLSTDAKGVSHGE